jgi:hypothetical protein
MIYVTIPLASLVKEKEEKKNLRNVKGQDGCKRGGGNNKTNRCGVKSPEERKM